MYNIVLRGKTYECRSNETLLDAFLRQGAKLNFSCQKGSCQVCMLHCNEGEIPEKSQNGLKPLYIKNNYFLPCQCEPVADMVIEDINHNQLYHAAYVHSKKMLSDEVCQLLIDCDKIELYKAGQYINLSRPQDGLARSYSLASYQEQEPYLELHIQRMKNGELSHWIFDDLQVGDQVDIQGPLGQCHYDNCDSSTPILMVAGNTGLAPLIGILKQALAERHKAEIHLYHVVHEGVGHYMHNVLKELKDKYANFSYFPCDANEQVDAAPTECSVVNLIQGRYSELRDWRVYLAGASKLVSSVSELALQKGVAQQQLYSDAFDLKDLRQTNRQDNQADDKHLSTSETHIESDNAAAPHTEVEYPAPDLEIWEALEQGKKLNKILHDFYTIVYADERLSPFFKNVTKQRSIEKVYLFLRQIFTGEKVYFGDRPKNAHHWMVISDELFDYREDIMESCLRDNGLPEHLINRWRAIEELFRPDIVKSTPWKKVVNGVELPLDGYEELELDSGSLCDSCQQAIEAGTRVRYHLRLGTIYCPSCMADHSTHQAVQLASTEHR